MAGSSTAPISANDISQYLNPYTQNVVDATTQQMQHDNASAMASLQGNQIAQGALGGNATGVAKGILAGQQNRTNASTIAGLYQQGYTQALGAAQQQQQTGLAGANALANYGIQGQNAALAGAGAQLNAGTLQQQTSQAGLDAQYQQYLQAQAYPYQQTQWLAGLGTGVGSNLGGVSSGSTTGPAPNQTAQYLGLGLSAAGMFLSDRDAKTDIEKIGETNDGQNIYRYRYKGSPHTQIGLIAQEVKEDHPDAVARGVGGMHFVDLKGATDDAVSRASGGGVGGTPYAGVKGWIPEMQIHGGSGAPHASAPGLGSSGQPSAQDFSKVASGITGLGGKMQGLDWGGAQSAGFGGLSGDAWGGGSFIGGGAYGGSGAAPLAGLDASDYGIGFARGGGVAGYAGGGAPELPEWLAGDFNPLDAQAAAAEADRRRGVIPGSQMNFEDRAAPAIGAIARGDFDPQGINSTTFEGTPGMQQANAGLVPTPQPRPDAAGPSMVASADDDEEIPAAAAPASGRAPQGGAMAFQPEGVAAARGLPPAITRAPGSEPGFGLGLLSRNQQTGLLTAGLSMLANRSPFLGVAAGEGGLAGMSAYGSAQEADRKAALEAEKLSREAQNTAFEHGMTTRKQDESERHNRATESTTLKGLDRTKFVPAGQYMGADGVYRPVAMDSSTGRLIDMSSGASVGPDAKVELKGSGKNGGFTDEDAEKLANRYVKSGDRTILQGLGTSGAAKIKVQRAIDRIMERENIAPEDMAQRTIEFEARKAGSRTLGTMEARMGSAAFEAEGAIKLIRGVVERLPRTSFLPFNQLIEGYSRKTLNPDQAELATRAQAIVNTYAAVMSRGANVTTDSSRHHAAELLNTAYDPTTFNRVLDTLLNEINMAKGSPARMQQYYREHYGPKAVSEGTGSAGSVPVQGATAPPPGQRQVGTIYDTPKGKLKWNGAGWERP